MDDKLQRIHVNGSTEEAKVSIIREVEGLIDGYHRLQDLHIKVIERR